MKIQRIATLLLIVLFPLFLISISTLSIALDSSLYDAEFLRLGVFDALGEGEVKVANENVLSYLSGNTPALDASFFNAREIAHLNDVKRIFGFLFFIAVLFAALASLVLLAIGEKRRKIATTSEVLIFGSLLLMGFAFITGIAIVANFQAMFSFFHHMLFRSGTYLFDPATENIVNLYPEELFFMFAKKIVLMAFILCALGLFGGWCMKKSRAIISSHLFFSQQPKKMNTGRLEKTAKDI